MTLFWHGHVCNSLEKVSQQILGAPFENLGFLDAPAA